MEIIQFSNSNEGYTFISKLLEEHKVVVLCGSGISCWKPTNLSVRLRFITNEVIRSYSYFVFKRRIIIFVEKLKFIMNYFEIFQNFSIDCLNELISSKQEEGLNLDFKTVRGSFDSKDTKRIYGEALSGFANSDGGAIVWGINTKRIDNIDYAEELIPIENVESFYNFLKSKEKDLVKPIIEGVEHKFLKTDNSSGFVITFIPLSDLTPHMSYATGEHKYYKRNSDRFYTMEHFDVEDMFGRRKKPRLKLDYKFVLSSTSSSGGKVTKYSYRMYLSLINDGRGTARYPFLLVKTDPSSKISKYGIDGNGNFNLKLILSSENRFGLNVYEFGGTNEFVIHPGMKLDVCVIEVELGPDFLPTNDINFEYVVSANEMISNEGKVKLTREEIRSEIKNIK